MNKKEFLKILELSLSLKGFTEDEKREILYDYEEHFRIGEDSSKTDEELIAELGDPEAIAEQYLREKINENNCREESSNSPNSDDKSRKNFSNEYNSDGYYNKTNSNESYNYNGFSSTDYSANAGGDRVIEAFEFGRFTGSIVMVIALLFFNLIFVVGPYIGAVGVLIGLFGAAIGVLVGGIGLLIGSAFMPILPSFIAIPPLSPFALFFFGIGMIALGILFFIGSCFLSKFLYLGTVKYIRWNIRVIRN